MIPVLIQDLVDKVTDSTKHYEQRQHYAATLMKIKEAIDKALADYETGRKGRK